MLVDVLMPALHRTMDRDTPFHSARILVSHHFLSQFYSAVV